MKSSSMQARRSASDGGSSSDAPIQGVIDDVVAPFGWVFSLLADQLGEVPADPHHRGERGRTVGVAIGGGVQYLVFLPHEVGQLFDAKSE